MLVDRFVVEQEMIDMMRKGKAMTLCELYDMLRAQYRLGEIGPLTEVFLEGYAAIDNRVGFDPAIPPGSPWSSLKRVRNRS